jgi:hypothetical protein
MHPTEVARLQSFREAARQIRAATIIDRGLATSVHVWEDNSGQLHVSCDLLEREAFVSLAASLRLVYMDKESGHFLSVCKVLRRHAPHEVRKQILAIRGLYMEGLRATAGAFTLTTGAGTRLVRPREVLEAWMYGEIFHQDADKKSFFSCSASIPSFSSICSGPLCCCVGGSWTWTTLWLIY